MSAGAHFSRPHHEIVLSKNGGFLKKLMLNRHIRRRALAPPKRVSRLPRHRNRSARALDAAGLGQHLKKAAPGEGRGHGGAAFGET